MAAMLDRAIVLGHVVHVLGTISGVTAGQQNYLDDRAVNASIELSSTLAHWFHR